MERDELERERKKKRKHLEEGAEPEEPLPEVVPPAALTVCNTSQDQMKDFKVPTQWCHMC